MLDRREHSHGPGAQSQWLPVRIRVRRYGRSFRGHDVVFVVCSRSALDGGASPPRSDTHPAKSSTVGGMMPCL